MILRLGKTKVTAPLQFQAVLLNDCRPGDAAEPEVLRGKTSHVLTIRVGKARK